MKANCDLTFLAFFHGVSEKGYTMDAEKEAAVEERGAQLGDPRPPVQGCPFKPPRPRRRGHQGPRAAVEVV